MTLEGETLGPHDGICFYTIGQRKGLNIGGEGAAWYVAGKDIEKNMGPATAFFCLNNDDGLTGISVADIQTYFERT